MSRGPGALTQEGRGRVTRLFHSLRPRPHPSPEGHGGHAGAPQKPATRLARLRQAGRGAEQITRGIRRNLFSLPKLINHQL